MTTKTLHLVWNKDKTQCFGTYDWADADFAETGEQIKHSIPSLADTLRGWDMKRGERLPRTQVEIDDV